MVAYFIVDEHLKSGTEGRKKLHSEVKLRLLNSETLTKDVLACSVFALPESCVY